MSRSLSYRELTHEYLPSPTHTRGVRGGLSRPVEAGLLRQQRLFRHPIFLDLRVQRPLANAEQVGGSATIAARFLESSLDHRTLDLRHLHARRNGHDIRRRGDITPLPLS